MIQAIRICREADGPMPGSYSTHKATRKIADLPEEKICRHPEHNPPNHMAYEPGIYEHTCPGCGATGQFTVQAKPTLKEPIAIITAKQKRVEYEWPEEPWEKAGRSGFNGHDSVFNSYPAKED